MLDIIAGQFDPLIFLFLLASSFLGSFITVALGIGGGALLLAIMASLMPPAALIPVHGVIQLGSNALRSSLLLRFTFWPPILAFLFGSIIGAALGGSVVVNLPPAVIQLGIGAFVIFSVLMNPPAWLSRLPFESGAISSFLTMFFGATGIFVANFVKSLKLPRKEHVATHAAMMTIQHCLKVVMFAVLGFSFGPWIGFIVAMTIAGFLGTIAGRHVLHKMDDRRFKLALDIVLLLISARLIWSGFSSLFLD